MAQAVLTRSYDNARTGANSQESILTPAAVASGLRKLFSLQVSDDPRLEAQPLIVPGLTMPDGKVHDAVYVCSMANTVWAFDANDGSQLWPNPVSLGTPVDDAHNIDLYRINVHWGILGTPVIDADTHTMYVVTWSSPDRTSANAVYHLHALDIVDASQRHNPLEIQATFTVGKTKAQFQPSRQRQRAALLLVPLRQPARTPVHKTLFVAFAVIGEMNSKLHGWVLAFDVDSFRQTAAWCTTPKSSTGGIWQAGQGPAADDAGNVYFMTGNGGWDGKTDFAESFVKLQYTPPNGASSAGQLTVADWWTPFRDRDRMVISGYSFQDQDLGSSGAILPPGTGLVLGAGKDGVLYVLDRNSLGKALANFTKLKSPPIFFTYFPGFGPNPAGDLDFLFGGKTHHLHGSPLFWTSRQHGPTLLCWGENENLRAWTLDATGKVTFLARGNEIASQGAGGRGGMPGGLLTLSASGDTNGVVWATAPTHGDANMHVVEGILRAYDATDFVANPDGSKGLKLLWDSKRLPGNTFSHSKFCSPVVWNGKAYTTTYDGRVDVYGL